MQENTDPPASAGQDPPWPTMHPADDYDGEHHPDGGQDPDGPDQRDRDEQEGRAREDRRMHEQLGIANDDRCSNA